MRKTPPFAPVQTTGVRKTHPAGAAGWGGDGGWSILNRLRRPAEGQFENNGIRRPIHFIYVDMVNSISKSFGPKTKGKL